MAEAKTLHDKLLDIQQTLKVPKDQDNTFANFKYRKIEDIEEKVKPLLKAHNLTLAFDDEVVSIGDRIFLKAVAILSDGNEVLRVAGWAQHAASKVKMDDAQLTGSCSTYARKYAVSGLFLIDNGDNDPDSTENSEPTPVKPYKKPAPVVAQEDKPTSTQLTLLRKLASEQGIDVDKIEARIKQITTKDEAREAIAKLQAM